MMNIYIFYFTFSALFFSISESHKCDIEQKCNFGYNDMINVHLITHTHDDAGWLKNIDEYYFGTRKNISNANVKEILNSVLESLSRNPGRKFSYVEASYIHQYLHEANDTYYRQRWDAINRFIQNGQLEIVSGGWVMHDEAVTHYSDIIHQMTLGINMFRDEFGDCASRSLRTGWQIDPFGHSAATAYLFGLLGFKGSFWGRISDTVKQARIDDHTLEYWWKPLPNFRHMYAPNVPFKKSDMRDQIHQQETFINELQSGPKHFISILPQLYQPPPGFCFDIFCNDDPIQDDINDPLTYNVDERIETFLQMMLIQALGYDSHHIAVTMGNDFHYQVAESWFRNLDKLIKYANIKRSINGSQIRFNLMYSTPQCYMHALSKAKSPKFIDLTPTDILQMQENNDKLLKNHLPLNHIHRRFKTEPILRQRKTESNVYYKIFINNGEIMYGHSVNETTNLQDIRIMGLHERQYKSAWPISSGGDGFPLVNYGINIWTGYYSSRPTFKAYVREASAMLQICQRIAALAHIQQANDGHIKGNTNRYNYDQSMLSMSVALVQHHDAVTGTAKQQVTNDYARRLSQGIKLCQENIETQLHAINILDKNAKLINCPLLNISVCPFTRKPSSQIEFMVYNPLPWVTEHHINIPIHFVNGSNLQVLELAEDGKHVQHDYQLASIPLSLIRLPEWISHLSTNKHFNGKSSKLLTIKCQLKPMSFSRYQIRFTKDNNGQGTNLISRDNYMDTDTENENYVIENENMRYEFSMVPASNLISGKLYNKITNIATKLDIGFAWYGAPHHPKFPGSDAYLFRSNTYEARNLSYFETIRPNREANGYKFEGEPFYNSNKNEKNKYHNRMKISKGSLYEQATIFVNEWLNLEFRLYKTGQVDSFQVDWTVGPIPMWDALPKDIVLQYQTDITSFKHQPQQSSEERYGEKESQLLQFFTDSNGKFMVPRIVYPNHKNLPKTSNIKYNSTHDKKLNFGRKLSPSVLLAKLEQNDPRIRLNYVAKQYYPMTSRVFIRDETKTTEHHNIRRQFGIISDRSQGVTSHKPGGIEIMVHRRLIEDAGLGVDEALNELGPDRKGLIARGRHILVFDTPSKTNALMTKLAQENYLKPHLMFVHNNGKITKNSFRMYEMILYEALPPNINILTFTVWNDRQVLLRLEHIYAPYEHVTLSLPVYLDLNNIFRIKFALIKSVTLDGGPLESQQQYDWFSQNNEYLKSPPLNMESFNSSTEYIIMLKPLEIKSYILYL